MADVCQSVEAVDISAANVRITEAMRAESGLSNIQCIEENIFTTRKASSEGRKYDTIVLDLRFRQAGQPDNSIQGPEINNRAMRILKMEHPYYMHVFPPRFRGYLRRNAGRSGQDFGNAGPVLSSVAFRQPTTPYF
jgi:hypothetical protein